MPESSKARDELGDYLSPPPTPAQLRQLHKRRYRGAWPSTKAQAAMILRRYNHGAVMTHAPEDAP
jgi:hypothetical protein